MGQAAVNLWAEEAPENPQPFVYAVSLIKLLLRFSGFVLPGHNALYFSRSFKSSAALDVAGMKA